MTGSKRALAVFAASALFAPLVSLGNPAFAAGEATPPAPRDVSELCANVPDDFDPFTDIDGNFFEQNIECLAFAGITQGLSGGNQYGPGFAVTRGQMASFIARLIDTANDEETSAGAVRELPPFDGQDSFIDVQDGYVHRANIDRLDEAGIVEGGPGGRPTNIYGPELEVTRAQMASFIKRALEYMTGDNFDTTQDFFTDDENAQPHEPNINGIAAEGIAVGDGNDTYNPFQSVSRAQMSGFLTRTLDVLFEDGLITALGEDEQPPPAPEEPTVTVETQTVTAGEPILITIEGDNIDSVEVLETSGDCVNAGTFGDDADTTQDGFQVEIPTNEDATAGECTVDLLITDNDGVETEKSFTVTIEEADFATVTVDQQDVQQGETFELTVAGEDIESVTISGDCVTTRTFAATADEDGDATNDSLTFTVPVNRDAEVGQCTITVVTNFDDETGRVDETDTVTINVTERPNAAATVRPELIDAEIVSTNTADQTGANGTTVRFTFDEEITGTQAPNAALFHVFTQDGTQFDGTQVTIESGGNSALVFFPGVDTTTGAADLTVATVDFGAVTDNEGDENPIGDTPIGSDNDTTTGFAAGQTEAPDLLQVQNFRNNTATPSQTLVDFVFDENAFVFDAAGFDLILTNGDPIQCTAQENGATTTDTNDFTGDGTTTITVACDQTAETGPITADEVARGIVQNQTVSDADQISSTGVATNTPGNFNPLQASNTPDGSTPEPDLVSATLNFNADQSTATADTITFTFDEAVTVFTGDGANGAEDFFAYNVDGQMIQADSVQRGSNANEVIATFADGELDEAVGASVTDGAVDGQTGTAGRVNEEDEVGVQNNRTESDSQSAGRTDNPDLIDVRIENDANGNARVVYVFDEDVTVVDRNGEFFLVQSDGTRLVCSNANATAGTTEDTDDTVVCTQFAVADNAGNPTSDIASSNDVRLAVVGTVDDDAVVGRDDATPALDSDAATGFGNPEGAELTTGGTGTGQQ